MVVGVGGEVSGDMWAVRELQTISCGSLQLGEDRRRRRVFLSPNFESLGNTKHRVTDALCSSNVSTASSIYYSITIRD